MVTSAMLARQVSHPNLPTVCFQELANPSPQPSISFTFVFMVLQTPFPANPFLAHQYKTPGVSRGTRFSDPAGRRIGPRPFRFSPSLTTFRMNTCKSVSKQTTLSPFRMNTYEKQGGRGHTRSTPISNRILQIHFGRPVLSHLLHLDRICTGINAIPTARLAH